MNGGGCGGCGVRSGALRKRESRPSRGPPTQFGGGGNCPWLAPGYPGNWRVVTPAVAMPVLF